MIPTGKISGDEFELEGVEPEAESEQESEADRSNVDDENDSCSYVTTERHYREQVGTAIVRPGVSGPVERRRGLCRAQLICCVLQVLNQTVECVEGLIYKRFLAKDVAGSELSAAVRLCTTLHTMLEDTDEDRADDFAWRVLLANVAQRFYAETFALHQVSLLACATC